MSLMLISCRGMKNPDRQIPEKNEEGTIRTVRDRTKVFVFEYQDSNRKIILFGHSMSCAIALKIAGELQKADGLILGKPLYKWMESI